MTPAEELVLLRAKLKASRGQSGLGQRVEALEAKIAELEVLNGPN